MQRAGTCWIVCLLLMVACKPTFPAPFSPVASALPSILSTPAPSPLIAPSPLPTQPPRAAPTALPEVRVTVVDSDTTPYTPTIQIVDFSFVDAQRGWILGTHCQKTCPVQIRATNDGGRTWRALPAPIADIAWIDWTPDPGLVHSIRFVDAQHGWAFLPGFFSTNDGGKTWKDEHRLVAAVEPVRCQLARVAGTRGNGTELLD